MSVVFVRDTQHYMVNEQVNIDMVEAAGIQPGDLVLEIGPGTGSLTNALVDAGANIIAVEKVPIIPALPPHFLLYKSSMSVVLISGCMP